VTPAGTVRVVTLDHSDERDARPTPPVVTIERLGAAADGDGRFQVRAGSRIVEFTHTELPSWSYGLIAEAFMLLAVAEEVA
jgi:hypothetical protein